MPAASTHEELSRAVFSRSNKLSPRHLKLPTLPAITKGPYPGEIVTGDHIIPRSICPELDNALYNLEMMSLTLNQRKSAKIGQRQIDLAKRWNKDGLLSDEGLEAVLQEK